MKKTTLPKLKKKAWDIYSRWIRIVASNRDGLVECVTCGKFYHWKKIQAGHFVSGRSARILFADKNVHPQCYACNCILSSNWESYYSFMQKKYGQETIERLIKLKELDRNSPLPSDQIRQQCESVIQLYGAFKENE